MCWEDIPCCSEEKREGSEAVSIVSNMVRDVMWKICDVDWIEKQQNMMLQFFAFLGKVKSLEDAAQKFTALAMSADKKEDAKEKKEDGATGLEDLYINKD